MPESSVPTPSASDHLHLSGAWNFRDVAGTRTEDGGVVRSGVLYRSSELTRLDAEGGAALTRLGVRRVFDLRGAAEVERSGADRVPGTIEVHRVPYENHKGEKAPHEEAVVDHDREKRYMMRAYHSFPSLAGAKVAIGAVVESIGRGEGPVLVHCAAGKDRAGWTVATVLRAAGVTDPDIVADFLSSNGAIESLRNHVRSVWGDGAMELSDAVLGVTEEYYRHGLATVDNLYGSFDGYLDALGIDADAIEKLRSALVTD